MMDKKAAPASKKTPPIPSQSTQAPNKSTLVKLDGTGRPDNIIEGSEGPIIFPFAKIENDYLKFHRSQLVHHNSEIAILVANKSDFNVQVHARQDLKIVPLDENANVTPKAPPEPKAPKKPEPGIEVQKEKEAEESKVKPPVEESSDEETSEDEKETKAKPVIKKETPKKLKKGDKRVEKLQLEFADKKLESKTVDKESTTSTESNSSSSFLPTTSATAASTTNTVSSSSSTTTTTSDDSVNQTKVSLGAGKNEQKGIHIPKANVKHYFQWQFEKLAQQMEDEDRCNQSDASECNIHPPAGPQDKGVGAEALQFHKTALKLKEDEYANRFLLLVGHCILELAKKPEFLSLELAEVRAILSNDYFGVVKERNVLRTAYAWLQYDPDVRKPHMTELMGAVRFGLLTKKEQIKCLVHNNELLTALLNVPPFQKAFLKSCLWNYAKDVGLSTQFKEFEDQPRISYKQFYSPGRRSGRPPPAMLQSFIPAQVASYGPTTSAKYEALSTPTTSPIQTMAMRRAKDDRKDKKIQIQGGYCIAHQFGAAAAATNANNHRIMVLESSIKVPTHEDN